MRAFDERVYLRRTIQRDQWWVIARHLLVWQISPANKLRKYESLEKEVQHLRQVLEAQQNSLVGPSGLHDDGQHVLRQSQHFTDVLPRQSDSPSSYVNPTSPGYGGMFTSTGAGGPRRVASASTGTDVNEPLNRHYSTNSAHNSGSTTRKRKRPHFEISYGVTPDFVTEGLISLDQAQRYFQK